MAIESILKSIFSGNIESANEQIHKYEETDKIKLKILKSRLLVILDNLAEAEQVISTLLETHKEIESDIQFCMNTQLADINFQLRRLDVVDKLLIKVNPNITTLDLTEDFNRYFLSIYYNLIGSTNLTRGKLKNAESYYKKSLEEKIQLNDNFGRLTILNNLGDVLRKRGDFNDSQNYFEECILVSKELGIAKNLAVAYLNLGLIKAQLGNHGRSIEFLKKAYDLILPQNQPILYSYILFRLIVVNVHLNDKNKSQKYLHELSKFQLEFSNQMVEILYFTSKAFILKNNKRARDKVAAQDLFLKIIDMPLIDDEITIFARLNLCQLLLEELRLYKNQEILIELREQIDGLRMIPGIQFSPLILADTYLLESNLAVAEGNFSKSMELMKKALDLVEDQGYLNIANQITNELNRIESNEKMISDLKKQKSDYMDQLDLVDLDEVINTDLTLEIIDDQALKPDEPKLFLILDEGGNVKYDLEIGMNDYIRENLVGSFISAINLFVSDAFSISSHLEFLRYGHFKIYMKEKKGLLFCYIFEGGTYYVVNKIHRIINFFMEQEEIWEQLISPFNVQPFIPDEIFSQLTYLLYKND